MDAIRTLVSGMSIVYCMQDFSFVDAKKKSVTFFHKNVPVEYVTTNNPSFLLRSAAQW